MADSRIRVTTAAAGRSATLLACARPAVSVSSPAIFTRSLYASNATSCTANDAIDSEVRSESLNLGRGGCENDDQHVKKRRAMERCGSPGGRGDCTGAAPPPPRAPPPTVASAACPAPCPTSKQSARLQRKPQLRAAARPSSHCPECCESQCSRRCSC